MKKTQTTLITVIILATLTTNIAYALPIITSPDDQNYAKNLSSTQINELTITDDVSTPYITAENGIRIRIPAGLPVLFDDARIKNELVVFGTSVDTGKVEKTPKISFEDKDKTLFIPVISDFSAGETLHVRYISLEGFNSTTNGSQYLELIYDPAKTSVKDLKYITVYDSTNSDSNAPEKPKDFKLTQTSDSAIRLTWTDPTDLDLQYLNLFRSLNGSSIDSNDSYKRISPGVQEYKDTGLKLGDTVKYQIRGEDGINFSTVAEIDTYTVTTYVPTPEEPTTTPDTQNPSDATNTPETPSTEPIQPQSLICQTFSDITAQDAFCSILKTVNQNNIIAGYSDGTFKGDNQINRAELLKLALLFSHIEIISPAKNEPIFSDVKADEWYSDYIYTAKTLGIIDGYPNGTFMPAQTVNKAEAIKIILKAIKAETGIVSSAPYEDTPVNQNNAWYLPYAQYLKDNVDQNSANFDPSHLMTRKEIVETLSLLAQ